MMNKLKPLTWSGLIILFGIPTILNFAACKYIIPFLTNHNDFPIEIAYFISVGLFVLVPMFLGALIMSANEIKSNRIKYIFIRMRIKKLSRIDLIWSAGSFILLSFLSFIIAKVILPPYGIDASPFFFQNMPLSDRYFWIIYVWPFFFFFNIFGEEFLWRGYIQPRQELLTYKYTWFVHGLLWAVWHLPMGTDLIFSALPIFFILPAVVQVRKNTTIAIVVHSVFGVFGFLSLAFGLVH